MKIEYEEIEFNLSGGNMTHGVDIIVDGQYVAPLDDNIKNEIGRIARKLGKGMRDFDPKTVSDAVDEAINKRRAG